jgi:hypothetical protein
VVSRLPIWRGSNARCGFGLAAERGRRLRRALGMVRVTVTDRSKGVWNST